MQPHESWALALVEMTDNRLAHRRSERVKIVSLGGGRLAESTSDVATLGSLLHDEHDLSGRGYRPGLRPASRRRPPERAGGSLHDHEAVRMLSAHPHQNQTTCVHVCYNDSMTRSISVRDLRNTVSEVLRRVEGGERLTVTVDRRPVAEIVPLRRRRAVPVGEALAVASRHAADRGLPDDVHRAIPDTTDDV